MMARYRNRGMALRPVHRIKHVVDNSATLAKATALTTVLIDTVDAPVISSTSQVETGSKVNGIYLKIEVASNDVFEPGAIPNCYLIVIKDPGNNLPGISANAVGGSDSKRYVIHQEMIMINNLQGGNPRILFNGVIAIPKGYRRFGPDDQLKMVILSPSLDIAVCSQCHYKEFR